MGSRSRYGAKWDTNKLQNIVKRRTYLGIAFYGDFEQKDAHEPLIDPVTWEAAQWRRGVRNSDAGGLLRGICRCANCRYTLQYNNGTSGREKREGRSARYGCVRGRSDHGKTCDVPTWVVATDTLSGRHSGKPIPGIESEVVEAMFKKLEAEQVTYQAVVTRIELEELDVDIARLEYDLGASCPTSELRDRRQPRALSRGREGEAAGARRREGPSAGGAEGKPTNRSNGKSVAGASGGVVGDVHCRSSGT